MARKPTAPKPIRRYDFLRIILLLERMGMGGLVSEKDLLSFTQEQGKSILDKIEGAYQIHGVTDAQVKYATDLIRKLNVSSPKVSEVPELGGLAISNLITDLKNVRGDPRFYGGGDFAGYGPQSISMEEFAAKWSPADVTRSIQDTKSKRVQLRKDLGEMIEEYRKQQGQLVLLASESILRGRLIRLAHARPELRPHLLTMLKS